MRADAPIPALDPTPSPGPPALFHALWLLTFLLHLLFVNAVLGGALLGAVASWAGSAQRRTALFFAELNSWAISLAITFGIAPLLFLQVLHGRFFYTATILVAWGWLSMVAILTVAYYLNYAVKARLRAGRDAPVLYTLEALLLLAVAAIQVAVHLLTVQPGRWGEVSRQAWSALSDPSFVPRALHFVLAAVSMAGVLLARQMAKRSSAGEDADLLRPAASFGVKAALLATLLQLVDGFWLLLSLPQGVLKGLMRGGAGTMVPLTLGVVAGLALLVLLSQVRDPFADAKKVRHALELLLGAVILMTVTRHQVRGITLAFSGAQGEPAVAPQWGAFALFAGSLVLCAGLTAFAVVRSVKDRPGPGSGPGNEAA